MAADRRNIPAVVPETGGREQARASGRREFLELREIGVLLRRYGPLVGCAALAGLVVGAIWALMTPAAYTATAQLVIDPKAVQLSREEAREQPGSIEAAQVESQMAVMRSDRIAELVINRLNLTKEPIFASAVRGIDSPTAATQVAIRMFAPKLDVRRQGLSYVIDVSFTAPEPALAAKIANAVADAYVDDARDARTAAARVGSEWLERRVAQLRQNMNEAALALQEFKAGRDYRIYRRQPQGQAPAQGAPGANDARADQNVRFDRNTLEELETTAQSYRKIYETALQGYAEAVQRQSNPLIETRMLSPATKPLGKSQPRTKLIMALGMLIGLLGGTGAAVLHWNLDSSLRSAAAAREALLAPCLGLLPMLWRPALRRSWLAGRSWRARLRFLLLRLISRRRSQAIALFRKWDFVRPDPFQQSMANIMTMMATLERHENVRVIGVTSVRRGEGKSTIASNLACLLAGSGFRILLIDADFRRGAISRAAGFNDNGNGLAHVLLGRAHVRDSVVTAPNSGVSLLPAEASAGATFDALLGSGAMSRCLEEALTGHDLVIVDLPSMEESPGAMAVAPLLSGVLMVVQWGSTPADVAANAVEELRDAGGRIIGSVLNKAAA
ncbi:hypothetical protein GCM10019059_39370 [Camelimonas fluminis]|uniref:non-specific protein-tyrosine kinase n=1 Tax=Camelimonas fluminis TaxID=1576911 RepID=A0ABV7UN51_9HYPH|nr:tyrosine-protein kinase domain-containing protein [Camelimonas fluminis]GHE76188.1 hypothetical protein GCM10019059_39370 [Camelimonas fluminis]